jgi:hypothetical protein
MPRPRAQAVLLVVAVVVITGLGVWGTVKQSTRLPAADEIAGAQIAARKLFDSLDLMPGAAARGERTENVYRGRSTRRVVLEQEFEAPGVFGSALDWYGGRLEATGWKVFDPRQSREVRVEWCKPPFMVTVANRASYDGPPPHHRHALRMEWTSGFTAARCPFPND